MKPHKLTLIFLLALTASATAFASVCKLNIRGENICLEEKALRKITIVTESERLKSVAEESVFYKVVKIKKIDYPQVIVEEDGNNKTTVSVDDLFAIQKCQPGDYICEKDKVLLNRGCGPRGQDEHKVEVVYSNEMIEIKTGGFLFFKKATSHILPFECVDKVI